MKRRARWGRGVKTPMRMLAKNDAEHPVPEQWHAVFRLIVQAFIAHDFQLRDHSIGGVAPIDPAIAENIADNISAYGDTLAPLNDETWDRSVYRWMDGHWQWIVDLTTAAEAVSDLALHARLSSDHGSLLEITSVHVP